MSAYEARDPRRRPDYAPPGGWGQFEENDRAAELAIIEVERTCANTKKAAERDYQQALTKFVETLPDAILRHYATGSSEKLVTRYAVSELVIRYERALDALRDVHAAYGTPAADTDIHTTRVNAFAKITTILEEDKKRREAMR